nr:MAG TPA: hypothetical protein [Caudoviricetes sp.]
MVFSPVSSFVGSDTNSGGEGASSVQMRRYGDAHRISVLFLYQNKRATRLAQNIPHCEAGIARQIVGGAFLLFHQFAAVGGGIKVTVAFQQVCVRQAVHRVAVAVQVNACAVQSFGRGFRNASCATVFLFQPPFPQVVVYAGQRNQQRLAQPFVGDGAVQPLGRTQMLRINIGKERVVADNQPRQTGGGGNLNKAHYILPVRRWTAGVAVV